MSHEQETSRSKNEESNETGKDIETYDPESLKRMEEKLIQTCPGIELFLEKNREITKTRMEQAQDSSIIVKNKRGFVTPDLLRNYPNSPTAQYTTEALYLFMKAHKVFNAFEKDKVLTESDCRLIQPGYHYYIQGFVLADHLSRQCPFPRNMETLTRDYLNLRPNDSEAEYFHVIVIKELEAEQKTDYEGRRDEIRALELFADKLSEYKNVKSERVLLRNAYYMLGSKYTITQQYERAEDAFRKCYNLDPSSIAAIYSMGYHKIEKEPEKALEFLLRYLDRAPKCDEKYPHAHFLIAIVYLHTFNNEDEAFRYYHLGLDAEKHRLPFNPPCNLPMKQVLKTFVEVRELQKNKGSLTNI